MKLVLTLLMLTAGHAVASPIYAIVAIDKSSWIADVVSKLGAAGVSVDVFNINSSGVAPTAAQLQNYKSVIVWTDVACFFSVCTTLGNSLDTYVRGGGGAVVAIYGSHNNSTYEIGGAFLANDDWAIEPGAITYGTTLSLGAIHQPGTPLLAGVGTFFGGSSTFYTDGALNAAATDVADWSNGAPLVAYRSVGAGTVVSLNMYPVSSDKLSSSWTSSSNGGNLMADALQFAAGVSAVPEPASGTLLALSSLAFLFLRPRAPHPDARLRLETDALSEIAEHQSPRPVE